MFPLEPRILEKAMPGQEFPNSPPSLTDWVRTLYGQVLFPGKTPDSAGPANLFRWLVLLALGCVICFAGLGMPLFEPDETRYAQIPREMLAAESLAVPLLDGKPYYDKPPLFYWTVAASYQVFGVSIEAARLVPALAILATVLLSYWVGQKGLFPDAAWRGALLLAVAPGLVGMGRFLLLDGLLTLVVFAGQSALWFSCNGKVFRRTWWLAGGLIGGIGLLTKGPIALILMTFPLISHHWLIPQDTTAKPGWKGWTGLFLTAAILALPWHVELALRDPEFLRHYLWEHHVLRFLQPFDHVRGTFYYLPVLALGLFPGSLLLIRLGRDLNSRSEEIRARRTPFIGYWFLCAVTCVGFFSLSGCKLPTYILPAFPAICLLLGHASQSLPPVWWRLGISTWLCILLVGLYGLLPFYARLRSPISDPQVMRFLEEELAQEGTGLVAYPRSCHSVSWQLNRSDIRNFRSKDFDAFREDILSRPRTVVLCTHRHSLEGLKQLLPPFVRVTKEAPCDLPDLPMFPNQWQKTAKKLLGETALGLCDVAILEVHR